MSENTKMVYITIKKDFLKVEIIAIRIKEGESLTKVAKEVRKGIIESNFPSYKKSPSLFDWAVYEKISFGKFVLIQSSNEEKFEKNLDFS